MSETDPIIKAASDAIHAYNCTCDNGDCEYKETYLAMAVVFDFVIYPFFDAEKKRAVAEAQEAVISELCAYGQSGNVCYICGDPYDHYGLPHGRATGDGRVRANSPGQLTLDLPAVRLLLAQELENSKCYGCGRPGNECTGYMQEQSCTVAHDERSYYARIVRGEV